MPERDGGHDKKAHNERIKREDQEERDRMAARKASLKKEFEDQIQTRRAILQGRSEDEETVKQAYVIAAQSPPDESLQKKVQKKKEIMGFLDYVRDFQTEQKKRNVEVGRLFEEEARKVMTKQQEVRDVKARAQTIRQAETKATLLDQMRAKRKLSQFCLL
ncbi:unnamed protein product [Schistocephalus solidus]|uniref:DUF4200 domain-containing protein n=1 Tax=Schistocephalus solidus TaxID=70667 RepID=A0A183SLW6_SCHSO|nr:unnamed protein product [Schistocephalus solidus]